MNLHINRQWVTEGILKQGKFLFYIILIQFFLAPSSIAGFAVRGRGSGEIRQSTAAQSKARKKIENLREANEETLKRLALDYYNNVLRADGNEPLSEDDISGKDAYTYLAVFLPHNIILEKAKAEAKIRKKYRYYELEVDKFLLEEERIQELNEFYYQRYLEEENRKMVQEETEIITEMSRKEEEVEPQGTAELDVTAVHCDPSNPGDKIEKIAKDVLIVKGYFRPLMIADINEDEKIDNEDLNLIEEELVKLKIAQEPIQKELIALHNNLNNKSVLRELSEVPEYAVAELAYRVGYVLKTRDEETYQKIEEKEVELQRLERKRLSKYDLNGDFKLDDRDYTFAQKEHFNKRSGNLNQLTRRAP